MAKGIFDFMSGFLETLSKVAQSFIVFVVLILISVFIFGISYFLSLSFNNGLFIFVGVIIIVLLWFAYRLYVRQYLNQ